MWILASESWALAHRPEPHSQRLVWNAEAVPLFVNWWPKYGEVSTLLATLGVVVTICWPWALRFQMTVDVVSAQAPSFGCGQSAVACDWQ